MGATLVMATHSREVAHLAFFDLVLHELLEVREHLVTTEVHLVEELNGEFASFGPATHR